MGRETVPASIAGFRELLDRVNPVRLKNNPVPLGTEDMDLLYHQILSKEAAR